jgi:hypothetical protein
MKFGPRLPSPSRRFAARMSMRRYVRRSLGIKAPRGWGWITNPRRAAYNRVYNRTTWPLLGRPRRRSGSLLSAILLLIGALARIGRR